jgi:Photosynthetic reaction centre cytochrome C subunit
MTDRRIVTLLIVVLCILLTLPFIAAAQGQEKGRGAEKGGRGGGGAPPTNLQVLPKDWTRQQVVQVMQGFNMALGVACNYCHVEMVGAPPNEKGVTPIDAAPDDKQTKKTARVMLRMVNQINETLGNQLGKPASEVTRVQCATCHRGQAIPKT